MADMSTTTSRTHDHARDAAGPFRTSLASHDTTGRPRSGAFWIVGGVLWVTGGLLYAESGWRFRAGSATWLAADLLLAAGIVGLLLIRPHGSSRSAGAALIVALTARALFAIAELSGLIAGTENGVLLPVAAMLTALASAAYAALAKLADRRLRAASLAMGLYFVLVMMPFLAITGEPNSFAIAGWGIPAALIGLAVTRSPAAR